MFIIRSSTEQDRLNWKGPPPMQKAPRPPPGLSSQNKQVTSNWISGEAGPQGWSSNSGKNEARWKLKSILK